jgi:hypothetical protein
MPNYKSVEQYQQAKAKNLRRQELENKIKDLTNRHALLCQYYGDSGKVRQELENALQELENL